MLKGFFGRGLFALLPLVFLVCVVGAFAYQPDYEGIQEINVNASERMRGPPELRVLTSQVVGLTVTVDGSARPGYPLAKIAKISWDWGDGTTEDHSFPANHTYSGPGSHTIQITAFQDDKQSVTRSVEVTLIAPVQTQTAQSSVKATTSQPETATVQPTQTRPQTVTVQPTQTQPFPTLSDLTATVIAVVVGAIGGSVVVLLRRR